MEIEDILKEITVEDPKTAKLSKEKVAILKCLGVI
jgi:hypothetical protein